MKSRSSISTVLIVKSLMLLVTTATGAPRQYQDVIRSQNPYEYYRMDTLIGEQGGTLIQNDVLMDQSSPEPYLASTNFPGLADNTWANFPQTGGGVLTGVKTGWNSDQGSISYWICVSNTIATYTGLFSRKVGGAGHYTDSAGKEVTTFARANGTFGIKIDGRQVEASNALFKPDEWHHMAFTWARGDGLTNGMIRIYLDGWEVKTAGPYDWESFVIDDVARFGKEISGESRILKGGADELAIWTNVLSAVEIQQQYLAAVDANSELLWMDGFQGCNTGPIEGQDGWSGDSRIRNDVLPGWGNLSGSWIYFDAATDATKSIGEVDFVNKKGILTLLFNLRATDNYNCLLTIGYDDHTNRLQPCFYVGTSGKTPNQLRVIRDASGVRETLYADCTTTQSNLMRCKFEINLKSGKGCYSYFDGSAWQAPAALQNIDLDLNNAQPANNLANWNAVRVQGNKGACFDNLSILYTPPPPPQGTLILVM